MTLKFLSIGSGSSGNCYFIGTEGYGILLDAGISAKTICKTLKDNGIGIEQIMAVFITHDHTDHAKSVGCLSEKYNIPVYATELVHKGIDQNRFITEKLSVNSRRLIIKEVPIQIRDFTVTPFEIPHDSLDNVGYLVELETHKVVLATDAGHINEPMTNYLRMAHHLIIEANYDKDMLMNGKYPYFLKQRIMNGTGHLSNLETAEFLASIFHLHLKNIWLCHLSKDNNHPELAYKTVESVMAKQGIRIGKDVNLTALDRMQPSELYLLA